MPADAFDEVTFVNRFTVHAPPKKFERIFAETSAFMERQDGFLRNDLVQHVDDPTRYVNIALWRNIECFHKAVNNPRFRPHAEALRALSTSEPNLYAPRMSFVTEPTGQATGSGST